MQKEFVSRLDAQEMFTFAFKRSWVKDFLLMNILWSFALLLLSVRLKLIRLSEKKKHRLKELKWCPYIDHLLKTWINDDFSTIFFCTKDFAEWIFMNESINRLEFLSQTLFDGETIHLLESLRIDVFQIHVLGSSHHSFNLTISLVCLVKR